MSIVKVKDKTFKTFIPEEEIQRRVKAVAEKLNKDMAGKNPLFLAVLNGSFIFAADLMRYITIPCEISFVKLASYEGTTSTGKIKEVVGINQDLKGRTVVIVEDIVDTGHTMKHMLESLSKHNPGVAAYLHAPRQAGQARGRPQHRVSRHGDPQRLHRRLRTRLRPARA